MIAPAVSAQVLLVRAAPLSQLSNPMRFVQDSVRELELQRRACRRARIEFGFLHWREFSYGVDFY